MTLEKNKKSGVSGAWLGSLEDSVTHSVLAGDLTQMGASVIGAWSEKRADNTESKRFTSRLAGSFNGSVLSMLETRSDESLFRVQLTLSPDGNELVGKWRFHSGGQWYPIKLRRFNGDIVSSNNAIKEQQLKL